MSSDWNKRTTLVHGGIRRSQYNEVSEAIFLTQGFVYDTAEQAEARFLKARPDEFIYARYGNPTVAMFEDRIAALEGAEDAFATASGDGGRQRCADRNAAHGRSRGGSAGAVRIMSLYSGGNPDPLRRRGDAGGRHRSGAVAQRHASRYQGRVFRRRFRTRRWK